MNISPLPPRGDGGAHDVGSPPLTDTAHVAQPELPLGETLRRARQMLGLTLRAVEAATDRAVTNGYLSQIEKGAVTRPSPNVLYELGRVYGLDYGELLVAAGHRLPRDQVNPAQAQAIEGLPMSAMADLNEAERAELARYVEYLRFRRSAGDGGRARGGGS